MKRKEKIKPQYMRWYEEAFQGEPRVRHMKPTARHFYRTLIIQSFYCSTRPYLPDDDAQLWMLADADSLEHWKQFSDSVRDMFTPVTIRGQKLLNQKRIISEWKKTEAMYSGKRRGQNDLEPKVDTGSTHPIHNRTEQNSRTDPSLARRRGEQSESDQTSGAGSASAGASPLAVSQKTSGGIGSGPGRLSNGGKTLQTFDDVDEDEPERWEKPIAVPAPPVYVKGSLNLAPLGEEESCAKAPVLVGSYWKVVASKPDNGRWCGTDTPDDEGLMVKAIGEHGLEKVTLCVQHFRRTNYWGCHEDGKVDGIKGFVTAIPEIHKQAVAYIAKAKATAAAKRR